MGLGEGGGWCEVGNEESRLTFTVVVRILEMVNIGGKCKFGYTANDFDF